MQLMKSVEFTLSSDTILSRSKRSNNQESIQKFYDENIESITPNSPIKMIDIENGLCIDRDDLYEGVYKPHNDKMSISFLLSSNDTDAMIDIKKDESKMGMLSGIEASLEAAHISVNEKESQAVSYENLPMNALESMALIASSAPLMSEAPDELQKKAKINSGKHEIEAFRSPLSLHLSYVNNNNCSIIKPKRKRANSQQLSSLLELYQKNSFPSTNDRIRLARKIGMDPRSVQIWFQNRRQSDRHQK